jgi:hypothetical protein
VLSVIIKRFSFQLSQMQQLCWCEDRVFFFGEIVITGSFECDSSCYK